MLNTRSLLRCQYEKFVETHPNLVYAQLVVSDFCRPVITTVDRTAVVSTRQAVKFRRDVRRRIRNSLMGYPV